MAVFAPARVVQAEKPWGSIRRDGFPARLGARLGVHIFPHSSGSIAMSIFAWRVGEAHAV
jgi:hypothetical protein